MTLVAIWLLLGAIIGIFMARKGYRRVMAEHQPQDTRNVYIRYVDDDGNTLKMKGVPATVQAEALAWAFTVFVFWCVMGVLAGIAYLAYLAIRLSTTG